MTPSHVMLTAISLGTTSGKSSCAELHVMDNDDFGIEYKEHKGARHIRAQCHRCNCIRAVVLCTRCGYYFCEAV